MAKKLKKKVTKFEILIDTTIHENPYSDYRIDYQERYIKKDKTALVTAVSAVAALQRFVNNEYADFKIVDVTEIPNAAKLQREIEELKAKLKEGKKPASRKKAKTSKKS